MVEIVTGVPGSGKSYYAMIRMAKSFSNDATLRKKIDNQFAIKDVDKAYTNVNELKLEELNNVKSLDMDDLIEKLTKLHHHYKKDKWSDKQLNELATEYEINNAMFLLDEAQNYFDNPNTVLIWWISYHRHFNQHIILITQSLALIHTKYKQFSEIFLKAVPSSLKVLNNKNVYKKYTESRMSKASQASSLNIKKFPEIYELYGSGANHNSKSVILPYLIISGVLFVAVILYFKFFLSLSNSTDNIEPKQNIQQQNTNKIEKINQKQDNFSFDTNNKLITVFCCNNECYYKSYIIPLKFISDADNYGVKILTKEEKSFNKIYKYKLFIPNNLYQMFDIETKSYIGSTKDDTNNQVTSYYSITK